MLAMACLMAAVLASVASSAETATCSSTSKRLEDLIPEEYDRALPPKSPSEVATVGIKLYVTSIASIDQKNQHISVDGYFRVSWKDARLAAGGNGQEACSSETLDLPESDWSKIWQPDVYFDNSLAEAYGSGMLTLSPRTGSVYKSQRMHHKFTCKMHFAKLPFDIQTCPIVASSYSKNTADLHVTPMNGGVEVHEGYDGTTEFEILRVKELLETRYYGDGENRVGYDFVTLELSIKRRPDAHMKSIFLTCILFALVSWSGTFIKRDAPPARVAISVIPVLIMLNLTNSVNASLPPLNYETWLTSFLFAITLFCLSTVFEYGIVAFLLAREAAGDSRFKAVKATVAHERKQAKAAGENQNMVFQEIPKETPIFKTVPMNQCPPAQVSAGAGTKVPQVKFCIPTEVQRIFNPADSATISAKQLRQAFRRLNKRFSLKQVEEIMTDMGVEGSDMTREELLLLLSDLDHHMPTEVLSTSFCDRPLSEQVDLVFRVGFVTLLAFLTFYWMMSGMA
eukprot:TRINITY_DN90218_c0_g1_i1.p1 TRINITY_DN90218_c0_g1~~TRINITY_DN90218_c0_g1_i1.p1  ORF type:complete len:511 (-),score=80.42 TRINITY_DN90218_c0_g1_i1:84-1616(-)